jgi:hypothetical protein
LSFQRIKKEDAKNAQTFNQDKIKLFSALDSYLASPEYKKLLNHKELSILSASEKQKYLSLVNLVLIWDMLLGSTPPVVQYKGKNKHQFYEDLLQNIPLRPIPTSKLLATAFLNMVSTFGSIVGCSSGVAGLLGGMGVFTTFASVPILGWSILGAGLLLGIVVAGAAVYKEVFNSRSKDLQQNMRILHADIQKIMAPSAGIKPAPPSREKVCIIKAKASRKPTLNLIKNAANEGSARPSKRGMVPLEGKGLALKNTFFLTQHKHKTMHKKLTNKGVSSQKNNYTLKSYSFK